MIQPAAGYIAACLGLAAGICAYWRLLGLWRLRNEGLFLGAAVFCLLLGGVLGLMVLVSPLAWALLLPAGAGVALLSRGKPAPKGALSLKSFYGLLSACLVVLIALPASRLTMAASQRRSEGQVLGMALTGAATALGARTATLAGICHQIGLDDSFAHPTLSAANGLLQADLSGYSLSAALLVAPEGSVLARPDRPGGVGQLIRRDWLSNGAVSGTGMLDGQPALLAACPTAAGMLVLAQALAHELATLPGNESLRLAATGSAGVLAEAGGTPEARTLMDANGTDKLLSSPLGGTVWINGGHAVFALQDIPLATLAGEPALRLAALATLPAGTWGAPL